MHVYIIHLKGKIINGYEMHVFGVRSAQPVFYSPSSEHFRGDKGSQSS